MIEVPPIERWRDGIEGRNGFAGVGTPDIPEDTRDLRLDFLPSTERTVSKYGIRWDKIYYYADVLDVWINEKKGGKSIKHRIRRDPHDISKVYFFDPTIEKYFEIPYSNITHPTVDIWELQRAQEYLAKQGIKKSDQDENEIFKGIMKMRVIERDSREKTAAASRKKRRKVEKKRSYAAGAVSSRSPQIQQESETSNVTRLPRKPKPKFVFTGKSSSAAPAQKAKKDYGEWS